MSANTQSLDHRWGSRARLDLPAELRIADKLSTITRVRDASLTGAFIETHANLSLLCRVGVRPIHKAGIWVEGVVVRIDDSGVGLEWCDPDLDHLSVFLETRK